MNKTDKKINQRLQNLDTEGVVTLLEQWDLDEFVEFVRERQLDGRTLMNVTEGIVKLWRPKINANKLILFAKDLKFDPEKYLDHPKKDLEDTVDTNGKDGKIITSEQVIEAVEKETAIMIPVDIEPKMSIETIESQYQTVKKTKDRAKKREDNQTTFNNVEELIKKIVPAKSFLYRHQRKQDATASYLPMDAGSPKKRKIFRISGYDYPKFDFRRFSKQDLGDRGYYPMKRNSRFFVQKSKPPESRPKYKSLSSTEELKYPEDHFYEDLCYSEVNKEARHSVPNQNVKPYRVKIQELFQSFKMPFFKRSEEAFNEDKKVEAKEKEANFYENSDSITNMYDSVHVNVQVEESTKAVEKIKKISELDQIKIKLHGKHQLSNKKESSKSIHPVESSEPKLPVEEYLEPVQLNKDYCDVNYQRQKEESLLSYIMSIFENKFGIKRETNDGAHSEDSEDEKTSNHTEARRWNEDQKPKTSMADRPLPVPVENEPYYMDIDRTEAENLLKGQLVGTFVLRPSSQPNHAYTLSVSCNNAVHNVGVRRRPDGRLALGFSRRGERSFADVTSLLRHHRKRRLLLVANGSVIGATTLNESPQYYQTPCNIPVKVHL